MSRTIWRAASVAVPFIAWGGAAVGGGAINPGDDDAADVATGAATKEVLRLNATSTASDRQTASAVPRLSSSFFLDNCNYISDPRFKDLICAYSRVRKSNNGKEKRHEFAREYLLRKGKKQKRQQRERLLRSKDIKRLYRKLKAQRKTAAASPQKQNFDPMMALLLLGQNDTKKKGSASLRFSPRVATTPPGAGTTIPGLPGASPIRAPGAAPAAAAPGAAAQSTVPPTKASLSQVAAGAPTTPTATQTAPSGTPSLLTPPTPTSASTLSGAKGARCPFNHMSSSSNATPQSPSINNNSSTLPPPQGAPSTLGNQPPPERVTPPSSLQQGGPGAGGGAGGGAILQTPVAPGGGAAGGAGPLSVGSMTEEEKLQKRNILTPPVNNGPRRTISESSKSSTPQNSVVEPKSFIKEVEGIPGDILTGTAVRNDAVRVALETTLFGYPLASLTPPTPDRPVRVDLSRTLVAATAFQHLAGIFSDLNSNNVGFDADYLQLNLRSLVNYMTESFRPITDDTSAALLAHNILPGAKIRDLLVALAGAQTLPVVSSPAAPKGSLKSTVPAPAPAATFNPNEIQKVLTRAQDLAAQLADHVRAGVSLRMNNPEVLFVADPAVKATFDKFIGQKNAELATISKMIAERTVFFETCMVGTSDPFDPNTLQSAVQAINTLYPGTPTGKCKDLLAFKPQLPGHEVVLYGFLPLRKGSPGQQFDAGNVLKTLSDSCVAFEKGVPPTPTGPNRGLLRAPKQNKTSSLSSVASVDSLKSLKRSFGLTSKPGGVSAKPADEPFVMLIEEPTAGPTDTYVRCVSEFLGRAAIQAAIHGGVVLTKFRMENGALVPTPVPLSFVGPEGIKNLATNFVGKLAESLFSDANALVSKGAASLWMDHLFFSAKPVKDPNSNMDVTAALIDKQINSYLGSRCTPKTIQPGSLPSTSQIGDSCRCLFLF